MTTRILLDRSMQLDVVSSLCPFTSQTFKPLTKQNKLPTEANKKMEINRGQITASFFCTFDISTNGVS